MTSQNKRTVALILGIIAFILLIYGINRAMTKGDDTITYFSLIGALVLVLIGNYIVTSIPAASK